MAGGSRVVCFPPRYLIDGKLFKNPVRQLAGGPAIEEVSPDIVTVGRKSMHVLSRADGSRVVLSDRRITPPDEWQEVLLCSNLREFLERFPLILVRIRMS